MGHKFKIILLTFILVLTLTQVKAQILEIGKSAEQIKWIIESTTKSHNQPDSYGNTSNSHWTWDVTYNNGAIIDVIQCYENQYLLDLRVIADYCKHYVMEKNKLAYVLTQFENISVEKLKANYTASYSDNKVGDLFFSEDFEHYSKIYLSNNKLATIEWRKTIINELPLNIRQTVNAKLSAIQIINQNKKSVQTETKIEKEKEIEEVNEDAAENKIFSRVEVEATFPGGDAAWRNFLQKNLRDTVPKSNGASEGVYTAIVKFIVNTDGSLSDFSCENDPGFGMCEEVMRVISKSKKWTPAMQNGRNVNAYRRQPITFQVN